MREREWKTRRMSDDPFLYHPGLRDLIIDPAHSAFRGLTTASVRERVEAKGYSTAWLRTDAEREALRHAFLADWAGDMWVFAYGSLMWDPGIHFTQVRRAHMPGYARRFILRDVNGGRGTPEAPGLMAALDHGVEGCDGLAFRIDAAQVDAETTVLWQREMIGAGYIPIVAPAQTEAGTIPCVAFLADHAADSIVAGLSRAEQVRCLATGEGFLGTSLDYLRGIHRHFAALRIEDPHVSGLLTEAEALAAHLAAK